MGTFNINLGKDTQLNLILGQQLENEVTEVVFDFSAWQSAYGSGTVGLSVQRHGDDRPYAVVPTVSGTDATWNISDLDTACKGVGEVQVTYTVGTVIKKSVVYKFTVYRSLGENGEYPSPGQTWQEEIEEELNDVKADLAHKTGLSDEAKQALLACFQQVAWIGDDGQDYYDALESALYPPANLVSISAVYTQSGTVYDTDSLDDLKSDLVVTAHFDDNSTRPVTAYTLTGTLVSGTSTITVAYGGMTTTFTVTVTHMDNSMYNWDFTESLIDSKQNVEITLPSGMTRDSNGLNYVGGVWTPLADLGSYPQVTIEADVVSFLEGNRTDIPIYVFYFTTSANSGAIGMAFRNGAWVLRHTVAGSYYNATTQGTGYDDRTVFNGKTMKMTCDTVNGIFRLYANNSLVIEVSNSSLTGWGGRSTLMFGQGSKGCTITGLRIYEGLV